MQVHGGGLVNNIVDSAPFARSATIGTAVRDVR
jgi:hypothetical protein